MNSKTHPPGEGEEPGKDKQNLGLRRYQTETDLINALQKKPATVSMLQRK